MDGAEHSHVVVSFSYNVTLVSGVRFSQVCGGKMIQSSIRGMNRTTFGGKGQWVVESLGSANWMVPHVTAYVTRQLI